MRFCRYERDGAARDAVLQDPQRLIDLEEAGVPAELLPAWADPEEPRFTRIVRAVPPQNAIRRVERVELLPPCDAGRMVLRGGLTADLEPHCVAPGGRLPAGSWSTGVAAVVRHDLSQVKGDGLQHIAGWTPFHLVDRTVAIGPWIVGADEVRDIRQLAFSAFLDDEPLIRPAKALLDWGGVLREAHQERPLRRGDLVALAAPARDAPAGADLRSALVVDGQVAARLTASVVATAQAPA